MDTCQARYSLIAGPAVCSRPVDADQQHADDLVVPGAGPNGGDVTVARDLHYDSALQLTFAD